MVLDFILGLLIIIVFLFVIPILIGLRYYPQIGWVFIYYFILLVLIAIISI